jgi:hypothetical protein
MREGRADAGNRLGAERRRPIAKSNNENKFVVRIALGY